MNEKKKETRGETAFSIFLKKKREGLITDLEKRKKKLPFSIFTNRDNDGVSAVKKTRRRQVWKKKGTYILKFLIEIQSFIIFSN